jgi:Cys-tRNA synthase (O-phospho-L-seryl-tRNA:Cys-tRNA synthase)
MEKSRLSSTEIHRLRRREAELLERIDKIKQRMNETKDLDTLAFKSKLFKEVQDELRRVQDKLAGRGSEE